MEKIKLSININAPKQKVRKTLWTESINKKCTTPIDAGAKIIDDWQENSEANFPGSGGEGLVSSIKKIMPNECMPLNHSGMMSNGGVDTETERTQVWAVSTEDYTLTEKDGITTLTMEQDIIENKKAHIIETWQTALEQIKELSENA